MKAISHSGLLLALLLLLVPLSMAQEELEEQDLLMTFIPNIQFAPVYIAQAEGYFADAGFDVNVEYLTESEVVELISLGRSDFGIISGEQVILAAAQERPIQFIYEWFQEFPIGLVYAGDGELAVSDLAGLAVGVPGRFGPNYSGLVTLLALSDLQETDVNLQEIGFNAPDVFCLGAVQAASIYVNNEPLQIQNRVDAGDCGDVESIQVLAIADVVDLVSNGLITSQNTAETEPDNVAAFVQAFDQSVQFAIRNPARAYLISAPYIEGLPLTEELEAALTALADEQDAFLADDPDMDAIAASHDAMLAALSEQFDGQTLLQFEVLLATVDLWQAERTGVTDAESWQNMAETLVTLGQLDAMIDLEAIYTNEFLPEED